MGYTLIAKNKELEELNIGAFSWPLYLQETGMGYVLGYGTSMKPGAYVYQTGNNGSPVTNDGYKVSATEAKAMALMARGYVSVQRYVNKEWTKIPEGDVKHYEESTGYRGMPTYRGKMHEDHLMFLEKFADWAEKSKGFTIN